MAEISLDDEIDLDMFEYWFDEVLDKYYFDSELLDLLMIATGNRETCLVGIYYSREQIQYLIEFCEFYDLNCHIEDTKNLMQRFKDFLRKLSRQKTYIQKEAWISRSELPKFPRFYSQEDIGCFLNYPETAIEAFTNDRMAEKVSDYVSFRPAENDIEPLLAEEQKRINLLKKLNKKGLDFPARWLEEFETYSNASS